jgi:hypothetical protein
VSSGLETGFALDRRTGGIALQLHSREPRIPIDIDIVVRDRTDLPRDALLAAGFVERGRHEFSDDGTGPRGTPVHLTDDPPLAEAIDRAVEIELEGVPLRILGKVDLLRAKLRSAAGPERRRSRRIIDLADVHALLEDDPTLASELGEEELALLERLPG